MAKRNSAVKTIFIVILFILTVGTLIMILNIGGLRDVFFSHIGIKFGNQINSKESPLIESIREEEKIINAEKIKLEALRIDLEDYRVQLVNREKEIEGKEIELLDKEYETEELKSRLSNQFQDLKELLKIYEEMDGEEAATILSQIEDIDKVLLVIKHLKKEKSAEILGFMDPKKAADILSRIY